MTFFLLSVCLDNDLELLEDFFSLDRTALR